MSKLYARKHINVDAVGLVERGANKKKRFPMYKGFSMNEHLRMIKSVLETKAPQEDEFAEFAKTTGMSPQGLAGAITALRALSAFSDELNPEIMKQLQSVSGVLSSGMAKQMEDEEKKKKEEEMAKQKEEEEKKKEEEEMAKQKEEEDKYKYPEPYEMNKALARFETEKTALAKELELMRKSISDMHDERELESWRKRAATELSHYPGKSSDELGAELHAMAKSAPAAAKSLFDTMKMTSDMSRRSEMFKPRGLNGSMSHTPDTALGKINSLAEQVMEKSSNPGEHEQVRAARARVAVVKANPSLYAQYLMEQSTNGRAIAGGV